MTSGKLLKKYFWFLRAFQSGPITRAEISRRWLSSPLNDEKKRLARSSFYHMKNELEELFDVSIACDKKEGWYIEQSFREDEEFRKWLLNSLAVESSLEDYANMHGRIMYESIPGGIQHLQTVVDAMQHCYRIIIRYGSFVHEPREFISMNRVSLSSLLTPSVSTSNAGMQLVKARIIRARFARTLLTASCKSQLPIPPTRYRKAST